MWNALKRTLKKIPPLRGLIAQRDELLRIVTQQYGPDCAPGHWASPIPAVDDIRRRAGEIYRADSKEVPAVDLNEAGQLSLLDRLLGELAGNPLVARQPGLRYQASNDWFPLPDAAVLYALLQFERPRRVIEVGSGHSSAVMLDADQHALGGQLEFTFIEPFPERLDGLLRAEDRRRVTILRQPVQEVGLEVFASLAAHDMLFIDSSHVSKIGSDVNHLVFRVLPALAPGVVVHFHDVYFPFEYPPEWLEMGRYWNEAYLLRAFLEYNGAFEMLWFGSYMQAFFADRLPEALRRPRAASLWLRKRG